MSTASPKDDIISKQERDIDMGQDDSATFTVAISVRNMLTRRFSGYLPAIGSSSSSSTKQRHRADTVTSSLHSTITTIEHPSHSPEKSTSDRSSRPVRTRSITMPSLPQQLPLIGDKKLFGKSDSKKIQAGDSSLETRHSSASNNSGLRNVVSSFIRKKNTTSSLSERSNVSESNMNESNAGNDSAGMPEKKSRVRKLRRRKVVFEADKRVSIMNERDNRGWDIDVLFAEADAELRRLKSRNSLDSAMVLSPVVTAALREMPDVKEDMVVDKPEEPASNTAVAREQDQPIIIDEQSTAEAPDNEQAASAIDPIIQPNDLSSIIPLEQQVPANSNLHDPSNDVGHNIEAHGSTIRNVTHIVDSTELTRGSTEELTIDITTINEPNTLPLHITASSKAETPSTPMLSPFELSRTECNRRSQLNIIKTRSGRLRLSPASSVAVTALHSEPVVSIGRSSIVNDYKTELSSQQPLSEQITGFKVHYDDSENTQTAHRKSRSGDLLRALAMQSSKSTPEQVGKSRQTRARAYTTSAVTASRPVSYADENDVDSFRRRPQLVGRSWRIFSWFVRSRDSDHTISSPSPAASPIEYHRRVGGGGGGGNSGAHTISDTSLATAYNSSNYNDSHRNANVRRRQLTRPSVRSIWPATDAFGQPPHILRQKINNLSSVDSSTDLKRHLLRPWSAVEPMESIPVKATESNHFIAQLANYSETNEVATNHLGMQSSVLTSKKSIPTLLSTTNTTHSKNHHQPRPLSSPSLLYGEDIMSRWREITPTLFDLHRGKASLTKQQQQQHTRRHLATLRARLSATRLALMTVASPRSSGNVTSMYQHSDLYSPATTLPNSRPDQPLDLVKQQQQLQRTVLHPLKATTTTTITTTRSSRYHGHRRSRFSLYEDISFGYATRSNSFHGFNTSHRFPSSVKKYTSTVEAASLRFSSMSCRRWSDLRHLSSSSSRYHRRDSNRSSYSQQQTQFIDTSIPTAKTLLDTSMPPPNTITRQLLQKSIVATSCPSLNRHDRQLPVEATTSPTFKTVSTVDNSNNNNNNSNGNNSHAMQLPSPSLADELRMLIIGGWRYGFFNTTTSSTFGNQHRHSMTASSNHSESIRYRSIRRRRPRSGLYSSRPVSNVSAISYVSSNNTDGWPQSEYGTLVQMEHFEGFDGV